MHRFHMFSQGSASGQYRATDLTLVTTFFGVDIDVAF